MSFSTFERQVQTEFELCHVRWGASCQMRNTHSIMFITIACGQIMNKQVTKVFKRTLSLHHCHEWISFYQFGVPQESLDVYLETTKVVESTNHRSYSHP